MKLLKRTWANLDLDHLAHNYNAIKQHIGGKSKILGVMKCDAYGHGAVPMSRQLVELGADFLAVSNLEEAVQIRRGNLRVPILIMGHTPPDYAETMVFMDITQEIHSLEYARQLDDKLHNTNYVLNVHLKIDTGMSRIGLPADMDALEQHLAQIAGMQHLHVGGVFTHFSCADSLDDESVAYTRAQYARFCRTLELLQSLHIEPELRHCCNSGATILYPEFAMDMVRPGISVYGIHPSCDTENKLELKPVMSLLSTVSTIRDIPAGTDIGYGRSFTAQQDMPLAIVPIGYGDGLARGLSNKGYFLIHGMKAPIVGRICMDMCMVDVSRIPQTQEGDAVLIFGCSDQGVISCTDVANQLNTIPYEIVSCLSKRVPRIYLEEGKKKGILQYIV